MERLHARRILIAVLLTESFKDISIDAGGALQASRSRSAAVATIGFLSFAFWRFTLTTGWMQLAWAISSLGAVEIDIGQSARRWPEENSDVLRGAVEIPASVLGTYPKRRPSLELWPFSPMPDGDRRPAKLVLEMVRAGKTRQAVADKLNISVRSVFRILRDHRVSEKAPVERAA